MMSEGYQRQLPIARNTTESMWPSIPAFLLWMIKDKLDIFDDMRLSAVCRDWWFASASHPRNQSLGKGAPCLLQSSKKERCNAQNSKKTRRNEKSRRNAQDFICVATKKKYTFDVPEFRRSLILYSKQGWFLMKQKYSNSVKELGVFLMNPIQKAKIKLPSIDPRTCMGFGSFSTRDGYPHCIVLFLVVNNQDPVTIKTAYPGDDVWTNHTYTETRDRHCEFSQLITIGEHVYCCDLEGEMLVYNMDTQIWKEAPASQRRSGRYMCRYVTEFEGHVIEVYQNKKLGEFSFFKYNDTKTSWEKLNIDDVKDTSWFLTDCDQYDGRFCFCKMDKGLKVYHVCSKHQSNLPFHRLGESQRNHPFYRLSAESQRNLVNRKGFHVVCYDLMDGSREIISLPYHVSIEAKWVDV